ncbi:hypothetical protein LJV55_003231 [Salmonella enterica]|nr:hypothetical protein [Salmonella enterica]
MLTINDFALMDDFWKSTKCCGPVGAEIINILKSGKSVFHGDFEFDIEFEMRDGECVIPGVYIVKGFPHGSDEEALLIREIVKYFPLKKLPDLWKNYDFLEIDRDIAMKEIDTLRQPWSVSDKVRYICGDAPRTRAGTRTVRGLDIHYLNEAFRDTVEVKLVPPQYGTRNEPCSPGIYALWSCNDQHFHTLIDENFTESFLSQIDKLRGR